MANYVLTPENTEIKISYRGLIPLVIIKSSLFDGKTLSEYDTFDRSALHLEGTKILTPMIGYGWQRKYTNAIGGETYYKVLLKSGGNTSEIDKNKKGVYFIVSPKVDIDKSGAYEYTGLQYVVNYYIQINDLIYQPSSSLYIGAPNSSNGFDLSKGVESPIFMTPNIFVFLDSNDNYKGGGIRGGANFNNFKIQKDQKFSLTYEYTIGIDEDYAADFTIFCNPNNKDFIAALYGAEETDPNNPYSGGGTAGPGGGGGSFSGDTDPIDIPDLPSISAVDAGFITIYKPSLAELRNLAKYMWSDLFSLDSFKKIFADPIDCILGLNIMPFGIAEGGKANVFVGNMDTGISMTLAQQQYVAVDCGSVRASEYSGSFFDYSPHTKYNIYLPYIGIEPLDPDEITGKDIRVVYHIDILTGSLICYVKVGNAVMYEYQGSCGQTIPINGNNFTSVFMGAVQIAGNVAGMISTGGASAGAIAGGLLSSTSTAAGMKPNIEKSGSLSGAGGFLGNQKPFIIKETPRQCMPLSQQKYTGFPSYQTQRLGSLSGYTEVESVNLSGIPANDSELSEIESLLKGGVYL